MPFTEFFLKILPLYFLILIGFMAGRRTRLEASELASINLYYIAPLIFLDAISHLSFSLENIILPLICFLMLGTMAAIIFNVTRAVSKDAKMPYWLAAACSTTNTGYFGIPVFLIMFGTENLGVYILYTIGAAIFTYTVTTYLFMRHQYDLRQALKKIARLPVLHAMLAGILCQVTHVTLPAVFDDFFTMLRGAYVVMGMMIIGLVLGRQSGERRGFVFEWQLVAVSNATRFLIYPALALFVVWLDRSLFHFFSPIAEKIILLVSLMPMGADTTSLAAQWNTHPERIAALTLVNSLIALFVIPLALPILLRF